MKSIQVNSGTEHSSGERAESLDSQEQGFKPTERPWTISGATIIWSPTGHSNVAAVSDPRPPTSTDVGYYEIRAWGDSDDAEQRFREACANAELIVRAVNAHDALVAELVKARDTFDDFIVPLQIMRRGLMAEACTIARDSLSATLALAGKPVDSAVSGDNNG